MSLTYYTLSYDVWMWEGLLVNKHSIYWNTASADNSQMAIHRVC